MSVVFVAVQRAFTRWKAKEWWWLHSFSTKET